MKQLRHVEFTMTLISSGVIISGLPGRGLSFLLPGCQNVFADNNVFVHYSQNCLARQQHVYLLQEVIRRYFCNLLIAWAAT